jgi:acyl carrier protein
MSADPPAGSVPLQVLRDAPEGSRRALLLDHLRVMIREILGLDFTRPLKPEQKLFEVGLKSRQLIELKSKLETAYAIDMPVTLFFAYSTLGALTEHLLAEFLKMSAASQAQPTAISSEASRPTVGDADIGQLSEEEAEARLSARISELQKRIR